MKGQEILRHVCEGKFYCIKIDHANKTITFSRSNNANTIGSVGYCGDFSESDSFNDFINYLRRTPICYFDLIVNAMLDVCVTGFGGLSNWHRMKYRLIIIGYEHIL